MYVLFSVIGKIILFTIIVKQTNSSRRLDELFEYFKIYIRCKKSRLCFHLFKILKKEIKVRTDVMME